MANALANIEPKEVWKNFGVVGNNKSPIGSYTNDEAEMAYIKGYIYNSVKSAVINKPKARKVQKPRDTRAILVEAGFNAIRKDRESANVSVVSASIGDYLGQRQKKRMAKVILNEARKKGLL